MQCLGKEMPKKLSAHKMVRVGFDLLVFGGGWIDSNGWEFTKSIYKLTCENKSCNWEILQQELKDFRYGPVAFALPDDYFNCT